MIIVISASGNSENLIRVTKKAKKLGIFSFGLLGFDYGIGFDDDDLDAATGDNLFQKYGQFRIILGFEPQ